MDVSWVRSDDRAITLAFMILGKVSNHEVTSKCVYSGGGGELFPLPPLREGASRLGHTSRLCLARFLVQTRSTFSPPVPRSTTDRPQSPDNHSRGLGRSGGLLQPDALRSRRRERARGGGGPGRSRGGRALPRGAGAPGAHAEEAEGAGVGGGASAPLEQGARPQPPLPPPSSGERQE